MPIPPAFYANSKNFIRYFYCQLTHNNHLLSKTLFSIILPSFAISVYELSYHIICFSITKQASCQSSCYIISTSTSPAFSAPYSATRKKPSWHATNWTSHCKDEYLPFRPNMWWRWFAPNLLGEMRNSH